VLNVQHEVLNSRDMMRLYYHLSKWIVSRAAKRMCRDCDGFILEGSRIIDLGCGSGIVGQKLAEHFNSQVIGADVADIRTQNIPFRLIIDNVLPFKDKEFDVCFISFVLHHATNPVITLKEAKRIAKDKIIIYEDLAEGLFARIRCFFHKMIYNIFAGTCGKKCHFKTQAEWEKLFGDLGLELVAKKKISSAKGWPSPMKKIFYVLSGPDTKNLGA